MDNPQPPDPTLFFIVAITLIIAFLISYFFRSYFSPQPTSQETSTKKSKKTDAKKDVSPSSKDIQSVPTKEEPKLSKIERKQQKEKEKEADPKQNLPSKKSKKRLKRERDNARDFENETTGPATEATLKKQTHEKNATPKEHFPVQTQAPAPKKEGTTSETFSKTSQTSTTKPNPPTAVFDQETLSLLKEVENRIREGNGETIFELQLQSNKDLEESSVRLVTVAKKLSCELKLLRLREDPNRVTVAEYLVRHQAEQTEYLEIRIAITGNVDSGKSTLLGVLSKGHLDNGRGSARIHVFRHRHEIASGRTSDIGRELLGFSSGGDITNYLLGGAKAPSWADICEASSKVLTFLDLAGHEKYLKTTLFGLTGNYPDYAMIVVGANMGIVGMTKEHFQLALALRVPVFIVVTKIDMCPPNKLEETMANLQKLLKTPAAHKIPLIISDEADVLVVAKNFDADRVTPIFMVSNVTGESLDLLKMFLNVLPMRKDWEALRLEPVEMRVDSTFSVSGVGTVVSGTLVQGALTPNQTVLLGPDEFGKFNPVSIKSLHTNRTPATHAKAGQSVAVALKKVKRNQTRKGMVLLDASLIPPPRSVWDFEAEVFIITHSTTISLNYEAVIHCTCTRQTAKVYWMDQETLRSGCKALVRFRYRYHPEFLKPGERLVFREGRTKGIGKVNRLIQDQNDPASFHSVSSLKTTGSSAPVETKEENKISANRKPFSKN
eukprot:TRINITY_DN7911_c0_g1_i1.p1 TRINITY_DN7911_c0_g1~~TRINITY_DN7911_c0_g1_i1.p1  ORF type:complete len:722 (-),score=143.70 TRINITY_DN7911_c0_g1_i1:44-2209(-)